MTGSLVFLLLRSLRGRLIRWTRLMRQPKYLIGFLIGAFWFVLWFGSAFLGESIRIGGGRHSAFLQGRTPDEMLLGAYIGSVALAVALTLWWLVPFGSATLEFKQSELHLLLPAPLRRRDLLQYALLKHQPGIAFGALIIAVFLTRGPAGHRLWMLVTFWLLLTLWNLHSRGRSLWLARQREMSAGRAAARRGALYAGLAAYWVGVTPGLALLFGRLATQEPDRWAATVAASLGLWQAGWEVALTGWLLQPLMWLLAPVFQTNSLGWAARLMGLLPVVLLVAVHNWWVVRSQVRFEEAALERAQRLATRSGSGRRYTETSSRARRRHPFALSPTGLPEVGIVWKNLLQVHRLPLWLVVVLWLAVTMLPLLAGFLLPLPAWLVGAAVLVGWLLLVAAPFLSMGHWRNDLRSDLLQLDLVRTWPLRPWRLIVAELLSPTVLGLCYAVTGAGLLIGVAAAVHLAGAGGGQVVLVSEKTAAGMGAGQLTVVVLATAAAVPVVTALTCLSTTLQNLIALTFPGWVQLGPRRRQTAARMGQNLLLTVALMLGFVVGLAPGLVLVGGLLTLQLLLVGLPLHALQLPVMGLMLAAPVLVECGVLAAIATSAWQRLDPSQELLTGEI